MDTTLKRAQAALSACTKLSFAAACFSAAAAAGLVLSAALSWSPGAADESLCVSLLGFSFCAAARCASARLSYSFFTSLAEPSSLLTAGAADDAMHTGFALAAFSAAGFALSLLVSFLISGDAPACAGWLFADSLLTLSAGAGFLFASQIIRLAVYFER